MIKTPPYLHRGDTIGIVAPAGFMAEERIQSCINTLENWGYRVKTGATVHSSSDNYFSGTDKERLDDLQQMLDDTSVNAILCARGGYGMTRIIDQIDFKKFGDTSKWIIGFSDITLLHSHLYTNLYISSIHGPMANAFNEAAEDDQYLQSLRKVLEGKKINYQLHPHNLNKKGEAVGELVGGNLTLIAHAIGTASDIKTKGRILFLEDVGEYLYNTDRMLHQLKRAGKLDRLAGLILGGFTSSKDTERPFGKQVHEIIAEVIEEYDFPVCYDFPVSHGIQNLALKVGVGYKLKVSKNKVTLSE